MDYLQELTIFIFCFYHYIFLLFFGQLVYFGFFAKRVPIFFKITSVLGYAFLLLVLGFPFIIACAMGFDAPGSERLLLPYLVPIIVIFLFYFSGVAVYRIVKK